MPKTRRNRKVGGKRRKSMKGGNIDIHGVLQNVQESAQNVRQLSKFDEEKKKLDEHVKAMQDESKELLSKGSGAVSSGLSQGRAAVSSGLSQGSDAVSSGLSQGRAAVSSGLSSIQQKAEDEKSKLSSSLSSFSGGRGRKRRYQRGGDTTPEEARRIAENHESVKAVEEELKLNIKTVDELMAKINAPGEHTDEKNQDIGKLEAALVNKVAIHEKLAGLVDRITKEEMSSKYLKGDTAHHADQAVKSVQANAAKVISDAQSQITEEVNERAGTALEQAQQAQEASKGFLSKIGEALGFGGDKSDDSAAPVAGGRRRKRKSRKTKRKGRKSKRHPKKGQKSKTRKGRLDFRTHKGDKYYNRDGHRQTRNRKGKKGRPYASRKRR